ncbi:MAG: hypothetical protein MUC50_22715 [Myxococcota bacterium]|jgi:hypothetical protein|nr:hypothetical protein [Myxococcota bacterium]
MRFRVAFLSAVALGFAWTLGCLDVPAEGDESSSGDSATDSEMDEDPQSDCGRCHHVGDTRIKGCETCHAYPPSGGTHQSHPTFECSVCHSKPESWLTETHPNATVDMKTEAYAKCQTPCHGHSSEVRW